MRKKYKKMEDFYSDESDPDYTNFDSDSMNSDSDFSDLDGDTDNASDSDTDSSSDDDIVVKKKVKKAKLNIDNTNLNNDVNRGSVNESVINKKIKKVKLNIDNTILNNDVDSGSVTENLINNKVEQAKSKVDNTNLNSDRDSGSVEENVTNNRVEQAKSNTDDTNLDNDVDSDSDNSNSDVDDDDSGGEIEVNYSEEQIKSIIIPVKSKILYEQQYDRYKEWCSQREITKTDKKVILDYFENLLTRNFKTRSLEAVYSRMKLMLLIKESINITKHKKLLRLLKEQAKNDQRTTKTAKNFTKEEVSKFLKTAPDDEYLLHKVALIIGLYGCLRIKQLTDMETNDIKEQDGLYHVEVPTAETSGEKSFILSKEASAIISKYVKLRPEGMKRFFLQIRNNKCTRQNVGKNVFSNIPKEIAKFLNLSDPELYTGFTFRRTGVKLLADGDDILNPKHGECGSNKIEEKKNKIRLPKKSITPSSDVNFVIPDNSKVMYTKQYIKYRYWRAKKKAPKTDENLILVYFKELSQKFKISSLLSIYSRLRSMILLKESIDISTYSELQRFLKRKRKKRTPYKSKSFTKEEISTFLKTAPDDKFLLHKVVLIIGLHGGLRREQLIKMKKKNIKQEGNLCHVSLPKSKTNDKKSIIINEEASAIIIKYMQLRPKGMKRFFLLCQNNKCTRQNIGKGTMRNIPIDIAKFLNLSDPELYRGNSFLRDSTILLADKPDKEADKPDEEADKPDKEADKPDEEADISALEKSGECHNNTVAQEDINEPIQNEINTSSLISNSTNSIDTEEPEILTTGTSFISTSTKSLYEQQYGKFKDWCKQWKVKEINETILLTYFRTLSLSFKATTLLAIYCRLKCMLLSKENIDISKYSELQSFIKEKSEQHTTKTTKVFTKEEVSTFLQTAPDNEFLFHKVVLIIGLYGRLRKVDLVKMNADSIKPQGNLYQILLPAKKTMKRKTILKHKRKSDNNTEESITLNEEASAIISKYVKLRPEGMKRFFLKIRNKKCIRQHVGINTIAQIPKEIAKFLNLSEPELYTGHAFVRSSTVLKDDKSGEETDKPDEEADNPNEETDNLDEEADNPDQEVDNPDQEVDIPVLEKNNELNHFIMDGTVQSHINQNQWIPVAQYNTEQGVINNYNYNTFNFNNFNYQENLPSSMYGVIFPGGTQ